MARPAIKKDRMETAAIELFATKGLARTTVRDIAAAAGVGEGALYRHWKGKNEMAWALFRREVHAFADALRPLLEADEGTLAERVAATVAFIYALYEDEPTRLAFILFTQHGFPAEHVLDDAFDPFTRVLAFCRREMRDGTIPPADPEVLASMVMGSVLQPLIMHRYGRVARPPVTIAPDVAASITALLEGGAPGREKA
ncbi:MAG: TetR/AcrR family transcriptional regulator [Planctomycetota bacterium]